ncbi:MAG: chemotaxis protein CheB [Bacillota bacterium]
MTKKKKADPQTEICSSNKPHNPPAVEVRKRGFPIIGIGASAGGLEALELFLKNIPEDSGMAFVIVQHLDPTRKDLMVELLQRVTSLQVIQVTEPTVVQPNCVYIIPPNKDMSIFHGTLHLFEPAEPRGLRLPVDFFFRSLADDQQEQSIGVILTGMGTDGTLGLGAIKERGGVGFVQEPASAKFDSMPQSAVEAGLADVIAPVEELPVKIFSYLYYKPSFDDSEPALTDKDQSSLEKIMILLRSKTGHDFSLYKKTTVYRRLERRMGIHQIDSIATYIRFLQENPQEVELLYKELLIGVTNFFRDPEVWEQLKKAIAEQLTGCVNQTLRAWVPGCATGEEAYTLAIVFKEMVEELKPAQDLTLQIFATDLNREAINKAREAVYPANIAADVSPERLRRFFNQVENGFQVAKPVREMVVFAQQNMIMDPPFTRLDILSCRNLLIYMTPELQGKIIPLLHYSLKPDGFLLLGSAESIGSFTNLFEPFKGEFHLYRRLEPAVQSEPVEFPTSHAPKLPPPSFKREVNLQSLADQLILKRYAPASILVNNKGDILYTSGRTGKYLEPAAGKANWNIFAMIREGLSYTLNNAFQNAVRENEVVTVKNAVVKINGEKQTVNIIVQPLEEPEPLRRMVLIVFTEVTMPHEDKARDKTGHKEDVNNDRVSELEAELRQAYREIKHVREENQASQEKLSAANEELQSTNEELQSTNEELTTSKEELQSLNEELQTINHELQTKVDELYQINNDMKNLLESTEIATLFLDNLLHVRRFTAKTTEIIKLIPGDVGRLITDIASDLDYPELAEDAREVLRKLTFKEKSVSATGGRWFTVKIMPYRTLEDKIDGLVITFIDITASKMLEDDLKQAQAELEKRIVKKDQDLNKVEKRLQSEKHRDKKRKDPDITQSPDEKGRDRHE